MGICVAESRIAITHKNVANMITKYTAVFGEEGLNISDMTNKSKGEFAYTLLDVEGKVTEEIINKLENIDGVITVRIVK